jgi:hypothetical protein
MKKPRTRADRSYLAVLQQTGSGLLLRCTKTLPLTAFAASMPEIKMEISVSSTTLIAAK